MPMTTTKEQMSTHELAPATPMDLSVASVADEVTNEQHQQEQQHHASSPPPPPINRRLEIQQPSPPDDGGVAARCVSDGNVQDSVDAATDAGNAVATDTNPDPDVVDAPILCNSEPLLKRQKIDDNVKDVDHEKEQVDESIKPIRQEPEQQQDGELQQEQEKQPPLNEMVPTGTHESSTKCDDDKQEQLQQNDSSSSIDEVPTMSIGMETEEGETKIDSDVINDNNGMSISTAAAAATATQTSTSCDGNDDGPGRRTIQLNLNTTSGKFDRNDENNVHSDHVDPSQDNADTIPARNSDQEIGMNLLAKKIHDGNDASISVSVGRLSNHDNTQLDAGIVPPTQDAVASAAATATIAMSGSTKHIKKKNMDPRVLDVRRKIQNCCKDNDLTSAMIVYNDAMKENIRLEAQTFYSLLNLCGGLDRSGFVHVGTPVKSTSSQSTPLSSSVVVANAEQQESRNMISNTTNHNPTQQQQTVIDWKQRQEFVFHIKAHMESEPYKLSLNETAYSAIVKILSRNKEFELAEKLLDEADTTQQCKPRLRLYSSLLTGYCLEGRMMDALKCWKRLKLNKQPLSSQQPLDITERESLNLMRCATSTGDSLVMQQVLTNLADDVPIPSKDSVAAIIEWFEIKHSQHTESLTRRHADERQVQSLLDEINNAHKTMTPTWTKGATDNASNSIEASSSSFEAPPPMGPVVNTKGWTISSACHIDAKTGRLTEGCLAGHQLQPVHISDHAFLEMQHMNESIVLDGTVDGHNSEFQGGRKGKKRRDFSASSRKVEWKRSITLLDNKMVGNATHGPVQVVIDGANVGYYQQNFSNAPHHVDYEQIDWLIRKFLVEKKQRVLVIMHNRHFSHNLLPPQYRPLCDSWERDGLLFKTPPGMNDDWFWMHASLKYKTFVVTNDEMRDHHFQMLAPRFFLRWKDRHQIHFDLGEWRDVVTTNTADESPSNCEGEVRKEDFSHDSSTGRPHRRQREVRLIPPDVYTRKIQRIADGFVVPLAKRGDENRFLDGCHVASEDEPVDETYLCIRPNGSLD